MHKYIIKRLLMMIPVIIGVSFLVFFIMALTPGDPARTILGETAPQESVDALREELGLNDPIPIRYINYMKDLLRGDLGNSYKTGRPVFNEVMELYPATLQLAFWGMLFSVVLSIPIGIISATRQYSIMDNVSMVFALIATATPNFWLGLMLIIVFALNLRILPSGGNTDGWMSLILPVITLGTSSLANITRTTRSSMLEVIRQDYIRTAKAKGVSKNKVINVHALKNALIPVVTVIGLQFGSLLGGAVLTETVFSWPGMGSYLINSIKSQDTPAVLGCVIVFSVSFSIVNLIVDILYAYIDPRIKSKYK